MAAYSDCPRWVGYVAVSLVSLVAALFVSFMVVGMIDKGNIALYMLYYTSIDSVSGLDMPPSKDLVLDPQFNLTIHLASSKPGHRVCMDAGTYLVLSLRCVPLATSPAVPHQLCVGAEDSSMAMPVVAKGTGVRLPGYMMDSLLPDLRSGVEAFEVRFKVSGNNFQDVVSCGAKRVGDAATQCGYGHICPDSQDKSPPPIY